LKLEFGFLRHRIDMRTAERSKSEKQKSKSLIFSQSRRKAYHSDKKAMLRQVQGKNYTVGGGLVLLSDSSASSLRFATCSNKKARSNRIFRMARSIRALRSRAASLCSSISEIRRFSAMHFW